MSKLYLNPFRCGKPPCKITKISPDRVSNKNHIPPLARQKIPT
jgi:hypothetical protein